MWTAQAVRNCAGVCDLFTSAHHALFNTRTRSTLAKSCVDDSALYLIRRHTAGSLTAPGVRFSSEQIDAVRRAPIRQRS
jgi:hypothetical protein